MGRGKNQSKFILIVFFIVFGTHLREGGSSGGEPSVRRIIYILYCEKFNNGLNGYNF